MKKRILGISGGLSFVIFLILLFIINHLGHSQLSQTAALRWSRDGDVSQVSCFFSVDAGVTEDRIYEFEHGVDSALVDASVFQESENPGARLWADAYSADGRVDISTDRASLTADAIGIGGDFFLFHPVNLLYGSYFSGNDLMQDYCVIDEDAAWQLFGSSDVAGMMVYVGGIPHIVTGVVERPQGRLAEAAGLDSTLVYVSYQTLTELGQSNGINHYEIVMPNPVTGFAQKYIKEKLGADEKETEVVENTSRYSFLSRLKLLRQFGVRSMNGRAIIYPYWENIARGYEDILAVLTLLELLFLIYPSALALIFFCIWWKHKGWTLKDVWRKGKDVAERRMEKLREERRKPKNGEFEETDFPEKSVREKRFGKKEKAKKRKKRIERKKRKEREKQIWKRKDRREFMRKRPFKKVMSLALVFVMALGLCACGGGGKKNENAALAKENVYKFQEFELPDLGGDDYSFRGSAYSDGMIYMLVEVYNWSGYESDTNDLRVLSMKEDGTDVQMTSLEMPDWRSAEKDFDVPETGEEAGAEESAKPSGEPEAQPRDNDTESAEGDGAEGGDTEAADGEESEEGTDTGEPEVEDNILYNNENDIWENSYYNDYTFASDGDIYALRTYYYEDYANGFSVQKDYICSWAADGSFQWERELEGLRSNEEEYVYVNSMSVGADGTVNLLLAGDNVYNMTVDAEGNISERQSMPEDVAELLQRYDRVLRKEDGTLLILYYDEDDWSKEYLVSYDPVTNTLGEPSLMPSSFSWNGYQIVEAGRDSDLICINNSGVYTYNLGDAECTEKMSLVNSDVFVMSFSALIELSDTSFIGVFYEDYESGIEAGIFNYVDPKDVPDKSVLVLGGSYVNDNIKRRVVEFNRNSDKYRIVLKDYDSYNSYDDYEASYTQLNNDIITGNMPDILITSGLPVENYVSKGLLADIGNLIEKDEELSQVEFLQNVFDAFSVNGKLYYVIPSFNVGTMIGKTSIVGDRNSWTMSDMLQLQQSLPEGTSMIGELVRSSFLSMMMQYCGSDFVDVSTGKCDFDSQNFIDMLEFAKSLPEMLEDDYYGEDYWSHYESQYREDRTVLNNLYIGNIKNINYTINGYFGEPVSYIGFPTEGGMGSYVDAQQCYAISARSNFIDGAWEFLRYYMTEEYQNTLDWGMPVQKKCFFEKAQEALELPYYLDENGDKVEYRDYFYMNGEEIELEPMSQEQIDQVTDFILSINKCYYSNDDIINIINEEAEAFFSGQKSAQEVVKIIQSRAQLYVDENQS